MPPPIIVIFNRETRRFRTKHGICQGWSNSLGFARHYTDLAEALADVPADQREHCVPGYVYIFEEPLDDVSVN